MRFLIHIPKCPAVSAGDAFKSVGLPAELAQGVDALPGPGPGGQGKMFGWLDSKQPDGRYLPDEQIWVASTSQWGHEHGAYSIGLWKKELPTEKDLRRPDHRRGSQVLLGNEESWSVPTPNTLERYPQLDSDGKLILVPDAQFNWLTTDLDQFRNTRVTTIEDDPNNVILTFDFMTDFEFLCRLMQVNYRITPEVIMHLQLFSESSVRRLIAELMGCPLKEAP